MSMGSICKNCSGVLIDKYCIRCENELASKKDYCNTCCVIIETQMQEEIFVLNYEMSQNKNNKSIQDD